VFQYAETCLLHYEKNGNTTSHPVLFDGLSTLPHKTKVGEALVILIAGADTTASTLTTGLLHILSNPLICDKLTRELCEEDSSFQLLKLEKLEYLVFNHLLHVTLEDSNSSQGACVKESLRIGMAVPGRLPRIVPQNLSQPLIVDGKVIPPGVRHTFQAILSLHWVWISS
jgi:cytochrome P450